MTRWIWTRWILFFSSLVVWSAGGLALSGDALYLLSGVLNVTMLCLCLLARQMLLDAEREKTR